LGSPKTDARTTAATLQSERQLEWPKRLECLWCRWFCEKPRGGKILEFLASNMLLKGLTARVFLENVENIRVDIVARDNILESSSLVEGQLEKAT
jgi:hypothetical protein